MILSSAVVFLVVYQDTGTQLRSEIDRDISGDTSQLLQSLNAVSAPTPERITAEATRYVLAQPYNASSTLLFVLMPGGGATSNHPEVFGGGPPDEGETEAEQASRTPKGAS